MGNNMGGTYLISIDNAIIAVGFGQYILEGKIDKELHRLTKMALQCERIPALIKYYIPQYRERRLQLIAKMATDLKQMNQ